MQCTMKRLLKEPNIYQDLLAKQLKSFTFWKACKKKKRQAADVIFWNRSSGLFSLMSDNSHRNVFHMTLYLDHRFIGPNVVEVYALEIQQLPQKLFLYSSYEELPLA